MDLYYFISYTFSNLCTKIEKKNHTIHCNLMLCKSCRDSHIQTTTIFFHNRVLQNLNLENVYVCACVCMLYESIAITK